MQILPIGSRVKHSTYGDGVVLNFNTTNYRVTFINSGTREIPLDFEFDSVNEEDFETDGVSLYDVERSLSRILEKWLGITEKIDLGDKWKNGTMVLQPKDKTLSNKEIPIETFFHKIVMLRDRLRVMEQKVNSSKLSDEEKVDIQQYITRCYGSLTTFNILFKNKEDNFVGEKGDR